ncbi:MAG: hypothetical protein Q7K37_11625, partial [Dehalococcoidia bacterium]|nr:hypothetical protein [Dehalococcoidia bacterium]
ARLVGDLPEGPGLAVVQYQGPNGFPARFAHLAAEGREVAAIYAFRVPLGFDRYIRGAPSWVNTLSVMNNGQLLMIRLAE